MFYDGTWLQLDSRERAKTLPDADVSIAEIKDKHSEIITPQT